MLDQPLGAAGGIVVFGLIAIALLAPAIAPHGPKDATFSPYLSPSREFPMGTDQVGRDVLSRVIWGARLSLYVGIVSVVFGVTLGSVWGAVTAYFGGAADAGSQRIVDSLMALPPIILALSFMAALGQSVNNVILALAILLTPTAARTVRSVALGIAATPYMEAAHAVGCSHSRIIFRHLMPNCLASYIVLATTNVSYAIVGAKATLAPSGGGRPVRGLRHRDIRPPDSDVGSARPGTAHISLLARQPRPPGCELDTMRAHRRCQ